jgi:hypothetical protein
MATIATVKMSQLAEVVWASLLAAVVVSLTFSLVVYGSSRSTECRRADRGAAATAYLVLAVLAFVVFAAAVIYGVQVMLAK